MNPTLIPSWNEAAARRAAQACGAQLLDDPHGPQSRFVSEAKVSIQAEPRGSPAMQGHSRALLAAGALSLLPDWGIVTTSGAEAVKFLHGQTTNDIEGQALDEVRLHGYCTSKGRLLAGGPLWRDGEALHFAVSRPLAEPLRKRLAMFVLRAKAKVEDSSDRFAVLGLCGGAAAAALRAIGIDVPAPGRVTRLVGAGAVQTDSGEAAGSGGAAPADGAADFREVPAACALGLAPLDGIGTRCWLIVPIESLHAVWTKLAGMLAPVDSELWRVTEILAGEPRVVPATSEAFIPQTLNWELVGGVSFRKGCYPGQEVVARLHYRGKPKRRTFAARLPEGAALVPGAELFAQDSAEAAGTVVSCAAEPDGGLVLLYEAPIATAEQGGLRSDDGRVLESLPLPYSLEA